MYVLGSRLSGRFAIIDVGKGEKRMVYLYVLSFVAALIMVFVMTPMVRKLAFRIGAVDVPNHRKVHSKIMPRLGGVAIYLAFVGAFIMLLPLLRAYDKDAAWGILVGGSIIVLIGALDDRFELSAKLKLLGQIAAASVVVIGFDLQIEFVNLPFGSVFTMYDREWLSIALTILWIVGVTNAINLIDGLDGLAAGVSGIAIATTLVLAVLMGNVVVILLSAALLGCVIGFLFFNFHPAKIFMGDSGALFLGFSLATLSILGFKVATLASFIVPIMILGVPLSDTFFAIIRRIINKKPISVADKSHLHHCLIDLGLSHRKTVLVIYGISCVFGICAVLLSQTELWLTIIVTAIVLLALEIGAEAIGLFSNRRKPVLQFLRRLQLKGNK